jgi:hypothetical protein
VDWNKAIIIGSQCVVVVVLGVCVAAGHNSYITDGLLAVSGSLAGAGLISTVKIIKESKAADKQPSTLEARGVLEESD